MSSNRPPGPGRKPAKAQAKSQKLNRTLQELEGAFSDWESLSSNARPEQKVAEPVKPAEKVSASDEEFRKKTKKLLSQLREQLAELND